MKFSKMNITFTLNYYTLNDSLKQLETVSQKSSAIFAD